MSTVLSFPTAKIRSVLDGYDKVLQKAMPLKAAHKRDLPYAVADLSRMLTNERGGMRANYWATPRSLSAYLRFFLPWNLYRLSWLLPQLHIPLKNGDTVLDLGSGPLTFVQALWLSRPDLRNKDLTFICTDVAKKPMEHGRRIFEAMAGVEPGKGPWKIKLVRETLEKSLRNSYGKMALVTGANVLNELSASRGQTMEDRFYELAYNMASACKEDGSILFVEPGTRLGGKIIGLTRAGLLEEGYLPQAPCPHEVECPMLDRNATGWCHFNMTADHAPMWLRDLTQRARMNRKNVSLSFLLASKAHPEYVENVRVLSDPVIIPGRKQKARYACSHKGIALLHEAENYESGSLVDVEWQDNPRKDAKTGALEVFPKRR